MEKKTRVTQSITQFDTYASLAMRTCPEGVDRLEMGAMGLLGESGELMDLFKKNRFQGHALNRADVLEELGDVLWYAACVLRAPDPRIPKYTNLSMETVVLIGDEETHRASCLQEMIMIRQCRAMIGFAAALFDSAFDLDPLSTFQMQIGGILSSILVIGSRFQLTLTDIMTANIDKLRARYPDGFTEERSINREC